MPKRYIILQGLQGKGGGVASLSEDNVTVSTNNCQGKFEIWLISSQNPQKREKIGEITGGSAAKFHLKDHAAAQTLPTADTILLTKNKAPAIAGTLAKRLPSFQDGAPVPEETGPVSPLGRDKFAWIKITDGSYPDPAPIVRNIFNNLQTIRRVSKYRTYYYGIYKTHIAVAIPSEADEANPFPHLRDCGRYVNGHWVVCADTKDLYYYSYGDSDEESEPDL